MPSKVQEDLAKIDAELEALVFSRTNASVGFEDDPGAAISQQTSVHEKALEIDHLRRRREDILRREDAELTRKNIAAAEAQARAARTSVWIAVAVGVAIALQAVFLVLQYNLLKWQADHPVPPVVCSR